MAYAVTAMLTGLGFGQVASTWTGHHHDGVATLTTTMVFLVIYR